MRRLFAAPGGCGRAILDARTVHLGRRIFRLRIGAGSVSDRGLFPAIGRGHLNDRDVRFLGRQSLFELRRQRHRWIGRNLDACFKIMVAPNTRLIAHL